MSKPIVFTVLGMCFWACGCSSEPTVLPAGQHAAVAPEQVRIYQKRPKKYEQLGTVTLQITPEMTWDEKGQANAAMGALQQKAAAMGADGLLLWGEPGTYDILATAGYRGQFYEVPIRRQPPTRTAVAQAIYATRNSMSARPNQGASHASHELRHQRTVGHESRGRGDNTMRTRTTLAVSVIAFARVGMRGARDGSGSDLFGFDATLSGPYLRRRLDSEHCPRSL